MKKPLFVPHKWIGVCPALSWFGGYRTLTLLVLLCVASIPAFSQVPAQAQNPAPSSANNIDLLDILLANGTITQQQYDTLKQRYAAKQEPQAPAPQAQATTPEQAAKPSELAVQQSVAPAKVVTFMDDAVGIHAGNFDLTFSGEINGFYVHDRPDRTLPAASSPCVLCLASTSSVPNSSLRNGLLPGDLSIKISTKQDGYDVAVMFGIWPGIESLETATGNVNLAAGNPTGFGVSGVDFRQQYLTVGKAKMGTFKVGRDLGFFAQEAILNDMTLLGAGTTNGNVGPGSVTLGRIGLGYLYTDFMPQISWTSPSIYGLQVAGAIFSPLSDVVSTTLGATPYSAPLTGHGQPQYQTKVTYTVPTTGSLKAQFWTNYLTQSMEADSADLTNDPSLKIPVGQSVRANGVDYGAKLSYHAAELVLYGYNGSGIGTEGLLFLATSPSGATRDSQGYYAQGTYTVARKWTLGMSYGQSNLSLASEGETANSLDITRYNASYVGQARYKLTKWVNLVSEYTHTRSESQARVFTTSDSFALGSIAFF
jgi:hypothetical protein